MSHYELYDGMVITSSRRPSVGSDFSIETIGEVDSDGEDHWYGQPTHNGQRGHVCEKHREQPRQYLSLPPSRSRSSRSHSPQTHSSRSRSRYEGDADYTGIASSMGSLSVSDYGSRTSRSRSVRSRPPPSSMSGVSESDCCSRSSGSRSVRSRPPPPPRAPSPPPAVRDFDYDPRTPVRSQSNDAYLDDDLEYARAPSSRSRGRSPTGLLPSRQARRLCQPRSEPVSESDYSGPSHAASCGSAARDGGGRTTADIRAELAELDARQAALEPRLYRVAGQGGSEKRVKGARTAAWVGKFVAGF